MLFQCHEESAQFNIILVLLNIIFKHNLQKLLNSLEFFSMSGVWELLQSCKGGTRMFWAIFNFVVGVPKLFRRLCWEYQNFLPDASRAQKLF